jgi:Beta-galactosidase
MIGGLRRAAALVALALPLLFGPRGAGAADGADYQIIMWQRQSAAGYRLLRSLGFTAAMLGADRDHPQQPIADDARPLLDAGMRWYVENIATDFYSAYHRYFPDRPVNWRFLEVERLYRADTNNPAARMRDPSLSDPAWLETISSRLRAIVETHRPYRPLFYNLADEPGIADLNSFWDFDFSQPSLTAMREWLKSRYGTLAALNAEWGTSFADWSAVVPMTTPEAMRRNDGNYAAWADFKAWMDIAFARAVGTGRDAVHAADPATLAGLEGGQKFGWGGYNYVTLSDAVDVMETEPELFPLVRALNPKLHLLSTSFGSGPVEEHRIWRALLNGGGGVIVWDNKQQFVGPDDSLGTRGQGAAAFFQELRRGVGGLVINSDEVRDDVAILYSPESLRVQWLLDWKDKGEAWPGRGAEAEDRDDNTVRNASDAYARGLEQLGFEPTYLSPEMIERGALQHDVRLLILPHAIALSDAAARAIAYFAAAGGTVIADTMPGVYDEHGKRLAEPLLWALFDGGRKLGPAARIARRDYEADPPVSIEVEDRERLAAFLESRKIAPPIRLSDEQGAPLPDVQIRTFRNGAVTLVALLRDMPAAGLERVVVHLPQEAYVYDVRRSTFLGQKRKPSLLLTEDGPEILAFTSRPLQPPTLTCAELVKPGNILQLHLGVFGPDAAFTRVLNVKVSDPLGQTSVENSGNVFVREREAVQNLSFAAALPGVWTIEALDVLSGQTARTTVTVTKP